MGILTGRVPLRLPNADGAFARLYELIGGFVYSRVLRWLSLTLIAVGAAAFVFEFATGPWAAAKSTAPIWSILLTVYGIQFAILAAHELAHGIECKRQGCAVNGVGLTLFYGIPCLFVDTTDVWMADRRGRIGTSWAGPYSGFVFSGALAITALFLSAPWGPALFQVAFLLNFAAVFNLLPFVEMDGYYMLVDWLRIPMLRARSIGFLRGGLPSRLRARTGLSRLEFTYLWFGAASVVTGMLFAMLGVSYWLGQAQRLLGAIWVQGTAARIAMVALGVLLLLPFIQHLSKRAALSGRAAVAWRWLSQKRPSVVSDARLLLATGIVASNESDEARAMVDRMRRESRASGAVVVREGEPGEEFFVIRRGEAVVVKGAEETELALLGPGDYFGELALVDRAPRAASVRALTRLDLLVMRKGDFDRLVREHVGLTASVDRIASAAGLGRFPALAHLSPQQLHELRPHLTRSASESGTVIISQGEPGERFYLIDEGQVELVRNDKRIAILPAGESFGESALLDDRPRNATARALTPVALYSMGKASFDSFVRGVVARRGEQAWTAGSASEAR